MRKINKIFLELYDDRKQLLALGVFTYLVHLMGHTILSDTGVTYAAGIVSGIIAGVGVAVSIWQTIEANNRADDAMDVAQQNQDLTAQIATDNLALQKEQQRKLEKQKEVYRNMEFTNPYADVQNPFADLQTQYENVFEDLTVNQQQAEFQEQQGAQQRADIMRELRGAAGGSGISALAQSLARQGALQTQQISAQIGQQEAANQRAAAQGAAAVQQMEAGREQQIAQGALQTQQISAQIGQQEAANQRAAAQGAAAVQQMEAGREQQVAQGAFTAQMSRLSGEQMLQQSEMDRQATLLGVQMGQTAGAQAAYQQSLSNQMASTAATANLFGQQAAALYGQAGQTLGATTSAVGDVLEYKAGGGTFGVS